MTLRQQLSWKQRWLAFRKGTVSVEIPERPPIRLEPLRAYESIDLVKWCTDKERVAYSQSLLANPIFRELLGVLATVRPGASRGALDVVQASILLGQRIGYDEIIATLLASARYVDVGQEPVPADYGAGDVDFNKL